MSRAQIQPALQVIHPQDNRLGLRTTWGLRCHKGTGFRYEKYCEAWHLLGDEQARVSPAEITIHGCAEEDSAEVESQGKNE